MRVPRRRFLAVPADNGYERAYRCTSQRRTPGGPGEGAGYTFRIASASARSTSIT